ncbi:MAG: uncharacterized protein QOJ11_3085 [Frankiales bacterium]|jgi:uncharacterized protein YfbU (UPF0304 family)|nr:uncharacterized protein [Frankiales bacterium]
MAQLNIRIDDETRDLFDALARARGQNTSDLLRDLIAQAVGRGESGRDGGDTTPSSLSAIERRRFALLHEIMANLVSDDEYDAAYHRQMIEVMTSGYTAEYYRTFQMIDSEMTERECSLVRDILDMFRIVEASVADLTDEQRDSLGEHWEYALKFRGFDFNDSRESRLASYAHFQIKDDRWADLADRFDNKHEHGNSHSPMLATYQRMLNVWKPVWERKIKSYGGPKDYKFSVEELRELMKAWPYPSE